METPFVRAVPARDPLIGRVLHDRYRVEKRIGKGGMGIVYLAEHVLLRRKVALKTLSDRAFATEEMVARFHREAVAAAALGSEHIVGVTDMGVLEDGSYFIVLEYLDGVELGHAVASQGPFAVARAVRIVSQLCDALGAVHAAGIVHRDLKPENLFLIEREGVKDFVKVLDFGVCKVFEDPAQGDRPLTRTGASLGTPQFMAPEQIDGSEWADKRADVYAAGAILYFALTGEAPFESASLPQLFIRISSEPPPPLHALRPDLPPALGAVIARALQKRPEDRYQSSAELRAALQPFERLAGDAPPIEMTRAAVERASTVAYSSPPRRRLRPRGIAAVALGIVLACVAAALSIALSSASRRGAAAERPRASSGAAAAGKLDTAPAATSTVSEAPFAAAPAHAAAPAEAARVVAPVDRARQARRPRVEDPAVAATPERQPESATPSDGVAAPAPAPPADTTAPPAAVAPRAKDTRAFGLPQRGLKEVFE